jgi:uncharacterized protein
MVIFERENVTIRTLASGATLTIPVFHVRGATERPKIYIQANIHGPEIAGIGAIYDLLASLRQQETINGSLTIVPSVNPVGLNSKINGMQVGYADLNETVVGNFNRIYKMLVTDDPQASDKVVLPAFAEEHRATLLPEIKAAFRAALKTALDHLEARTAPYGFSYGEKLAFSIQRMSYDADYLIDLHTAGDAIYHMYTFPECLQSVPYFDLHHTVLLDKSFSGVLDESFLQPWLRLREAFTKVGREIPFSMFELEAFTPELGSADTLDRGAMQADAERVLNYLRHKGVLSGKSKQHPGDYHYCTQENYRRYRATTGGLLLWHKQPGDSVETGEKIVTILRTYALNVDSIGETETVIGAVEAGVMINRTETQVVHEGLSLCSIMTNIEVL